MGAGSNKSAEIKKINTDMRAARLKAEDERVEAAQRRKEQRERVALSSDEWDDED